MPLTDTQIAKLPWRQASYALPVGARGLRLAIFPRGRKTWQLRANIGGKAAIVTVGHWPEMSADGARRRARARRWSWSWPDNPRP